MNKLYIVTLCVLLFTLSFSAVIGFKFLRTQTTQVNPPSQLAVVTPPSFTPTVIKYESAPPAQSLPGRITLSSGEVRKFPRRGKETVVVDNTQTLLEGEQIIASKSATAMVSFGTASTFSITPETVVTVVSSNPKNFLTQLINGTVAFETDEIVATISARTLHGLFSISDGKATLSTDSEKKLIRFSIEEGTGNLGYIDTDNNTQSVEVKRGITLIFNDQKRTFTVKPL